MNEALQADDSVAKKRYLAKLEECRNDLQHLFPHWIAMSDESRLHQSPQRSEAEKIRKRELERQKLRLQRIELYAKSRHQPVRTYESALLVRFANWLSDHLNAYYEPKPWLCADRAAAQRTMDRELGRSDSDGAFAVCPSDAAPLPRSQSLWSFLRVKPHAPGGYDVMVIYQAMLKEAHVDVTPDGYLTLDGRDKFGEIGELVHFYQSFPFYTDAQGRSLRLKQPLRGGGGARAFHERLLQRLPVKLELFPINLRFLADLRLLGWVATSAYLLWQFRSPLPFILLAVLIAFCTSVWNMAKEF